MLKWQYGTELWGMDLKVNRGDVFWVNLDPTVGSEIRKQRPCVLVGANPINKAPTARL